MSYTAKDFCKGTRWRVIRSGARLWGWTSIPGGQQGWGLDLPLGMILTCEGSSMTSGDGVPAIKWTDENGKFLVSDCTFRPVKGGMWGGQVPADGYLEPVEGE
jgi:hypothetical protein